MSASPLIVTTSWDDGHSLDLKMASLLAQFGLKGTFYVTFNDPGGRPEISPEEIRQLAAMGMEVGSHTLSHRLLVQVPIDQIFRELDESKRRLEEILGSPISAVSYPLGYTNSTVHDAWKKSGYRLGRTTEAFRWSLDFDPWRMPVTVELNPATRMMIARHAARDANLLGLWRWLRHTGLQTNPIRLARRLFACVAHRGGVFHLIGRSPDVEHLGLWDDLKSLFEEISQTRPLLALTNSQVLDRARTAAPAAAGSPAQTPGA